MPDFTPATPLDLFRHRNFVLLIAARLLSTIGMLMLSTALGWQVYSLARATHSVEQSALIMGLIGLVQFIPMFAMTLPAGALVDRYDRRVILGACIALLIACTAALAVYTAMPAPALLPYFLISVPMGVARAFAMPATIALGPMLVPRALLPRAIAWNSLAMQAGFIAGPWIGGLLCVVSPALAFAAATFCYVTAGAAIFFIRANTRPGHIGGSRLALIVEGLTYVWSNKVVLGGISLDLFAVLLGGATALLPVFARDVLHIGPDGFGLLRSGPALGGGLMAVALALRPVQRQAGLWLLASVAVFGAAMLVFAFSRWLALSLIALAVSGAADTISMYVRQSIIQIMTPDAMRGRVSAVSSLFVSASNELGEFESGVAARFLGPVGAVILGGAGSIGVTALWAKLFPELRRVDRMDAAE